MFTAASVETRVLVERLENMIAIVLPRRLFERLGGNDSPDLSADLCAEALRMSVVSSAGVRSAIVRRWRGANGEVGRTVGRESL
jgi:hypothetical protein